jgi:hypothetical protein
LNPHRPPAASQYYDDFYAWTQDQAKALRALERHSETLPVKVDLGAIAEEIEELGKTELHTGVGLTQQILIHLIKAASAPHAKALSHWRVKATTFSVRLSERYVPLMRRKIDMQRIWRGAVKVAAATLQEHEGKLARNLPEGCPFTVGDIVSDAFDFDNVLARLCTATAR